MVNREVLGAQGRGCLIGACPHAAIALQFPLRDSYDRLTILQCKVMKCRSCSTSFPFLLTTFAALGVDTYVVVVFSFVLEQKGASIRYAFS